MSLDPRPAHPLTSREVAKLISGLLGGVASWCEPDAIADALQHFEQNRAHYIESFRLARELARDNLRAHGYPVTPE